MWTLTNVISYISNQFSFNLFKTMQSNDGETTGTKSFKGLVTSKIKDIS